MGVKFSHTTTHSFAVRQQARPRHFQKISDRPFSRTFLGQIDAFAAVSPDPACGGRNYGIMIAW
jgi:hypothetical protein